MEIRNYGPKRITLHETYWKTGEVIDREHNVMPLSESSLNRMMEHGKNGMVIISSQVSQIDRDDPKLSLRDQFERDTMGLNLDSDAVYDEERKWLRKRNAWADKALKRDIMNAGYSFSPVYGGYKGKEDQAEYEPSYVVYCFKMDGQPADFEQLKEDALKWCLKYKQESVYIQAPGEPPAYLNYEGRRVSSDSSDSFKFNDDSQEFFTTTKRDKAEPKKFTADIQFNECYIPLRPGDLNEKRRRLKQGEYIL